MLRLKQSPNARHEARGHGVESAMEVAPRKYFDGAERRRMPMYDDSLALERSVPRLELLKKEEALRTEKVFM